MTHWPTSIQTRMSFAPRCDPTWVGPGHGFPRKGDCVFSPSVSRHWVACYESKGKELAGVAQIPGEIDLAPSPLDRPELGLLEFWPVGGRPPHVLL